MYQSKLKTMGEAVTPTSLCLDCTGRCVGCTGSCVSTCDMQCARTCDGSCETSTGITAINTDVNA